jgi:hypothetical protein
MYVLSWVLTMVVALIATSTIVYALPRSADDELSVATVSQSLFGADTNRMSTIFVSCVTDKD